METKSTLSLTGEALVRRQLRRKAFPLLAMAVFAGSIALVCLGLLFLFGCWLGPLLVWFVEPVPTFLPPLSGTLFLAVLFVSVRQAGFRYWASATYDSKARGEIPVAESGNIIHGEEWYFLTYCLSSGNCAQRGPGLPADMQLFGPASTGLVIKMLAMPFLLGPLLLTGSFRALNEVRHLLATDAQRLARLLQVAFANGGRCSFATLQDAVPDFSPETDTRMLLAIDGVIVLHKEMQGIALADELAAEIRRVTAARTGQSAS
ncbi:MAG: hypothetical protein WC708_18325 [Lentisphaeria bacterium]